MLNLMCLILMLAAGTNVLAADAIPVTRTNITDDVETKIVDIITSDVDRLAVDAIVDGNASVIPGAIGDRFFEYLKNGGSSDQNVDGSVTPVTFTIGSHATKDKIVTQLRCFGSSSTIKFEQYLGISTELTNGIEIKITSEATVFTFELIKATEDWKNLFSMPDPNAFNIDVQPSANQFQGVFRPVPGFKLVANTSDKVDVKIQDDLDESQLITQECAILGFYQ